MSKANNDKVVLEKLPAGLKESIFSNALNFSVLGCNKYEIPD
jgi:hypothetical protein